MGQHLDIAKEFFTKITLQIFPKAKNFMNDAYQVCPFTTTKRITKTSYQIHNDNDPTNTKTVHRNHLVEYYPKEETLAPMIEKYIPMDQRHGDLLRYSWNNELRS